MNLTPVLSSFKSLLQNSSGVGLIVDMMSFVDGRHGIQVGRDEDREIFSVVVVDFDDGLIEEGDTKRSHYDPLVSREGGSE